MKMKGLAVAVLILAFALSACSGRRENDGQGFLARSSGTVGNADMYENFAPGAAYPGESYLEIDENEEKLTEQESMLTFSLKVDTASYMNVQRYIDSGSVPPEDAVRTEELINYFNYDADLSFDGAPFAIYTEVAQSPFDEDRHIAFIRVKTPDVDKEMLPSSNLTFLIDTSGSMDSYDKLPLLKEAFGLLVETLDEDDRVSIVTYAGSSEVVLDGVSGGDKERILSAINRLEPEGSTAGAQGILTAYALAEKNFLEDGNNRVILATDGDFNVGVSSNEALSRLIREKRDSGVYLSILGFGAGNIRDDLMETLSKDGNGNYAYINSVDAAKKVLVEELASSLFTVADDVKAQIEFNPENVKSYRLIGYENRALRNEDFNNDSKDAGEIGVGSDVVVLFELQLQNASGGSGLKYQGNTEPREETQASEFAGELFEVRIRYKNPGKSDSKLVTRPVMKDSIDGYGSSDLRFACAVAGFGELLRGSEYAVPVRDIFPVAESSLGEDRGGYRQQFLELLRKYQKLA